MRSGDDARAVGGGWPPNLAARIVFGDDDVLVADKPARLPLEATEPDDRGDFVSILRAAKPSSPPGPQSHEPPYLVAQHHLDRDTSGLVVLTRNPEATRKMVATATSKPVRTAYVAAVTGRLPARVERGLEGWASKDASGRVRVRLQRFGRASAIRCEARVLRANGDRALLELVPDSGGGRHVRALLAAHKLLIAGDDQAGGRPAHRLMMHAARVEFLHPRTGRNVVAEAPAPWDFDVWVRDAWVRFELDAETYRRAFEGASVLRLGLERRRETQTFRLFHGEGEGLPGIDLDRFGEHLVVWIDEQVPESARQRILEAAWAQRPRGLYLKVRPRTASRLDESRREALAPRLPVRGEAAPEEMTVLEHGLGYLVRMSDGLATGLFLDQRLNRLWLRDQAENARVLNLFAYTCAFTVAAAAGGARSTVSVDISARALETGHRNLQRGNLDGRQHEFVRDDVSRWVGMARSKGRLFDIIVLDPPSFGSSHHGRFSAEADYGKLAEECMGLLPPEGGAMLACTNHRGVTMGRLRAWLKAAAERAGRKIESMKEPPAAADFPAPALGEPHLKALRVRLAPG